MKDWTFGNENDWQSLAVYNEKGSNSYTQIPDGIVFSFPCEIKNKGQVQILKDLSIDDELSASLIKKTVDELIADKTLIHHLLI